MYPKAQENSLLRIKWIKNEEILPENEPGKLKYFFQKVHIQTEAVREFFSSL